MVDQICCGTMNTWSPMRKSAVLSACCSVKTTVLLSGALTLLRMVAQSEPWSRAGCCCIRLKVKATSALVKGCPSFHFTSVRSLHVNTVRSVEKVQLLASQG